VRRARRLRRRSALNRHEVTFTFRVLHGSKVPGLLGSLIPVRPQRSLKRTALPVFLPLPAPKDATLWAILSWRSVLLHGFTQRLRPRPLDQGHLSWGFVSPTALQKERVHVTSGFPDELPGGNRESIDRSHPADYGAACRLSQPLSGFLPLPNALPFSDRWRSWGLPYRVLFLPQRPGCSSPPVCPLDVAPSVWPVPVPRRGPPMAHQPFA
jgi:hypothetical protein